MGELLPVGKVQNSPPRKIILMTGLGAKNQYHNEFSFIEGAKQIYGSVIADNRSLI